MLQLPLRQPFQHSVDTRVLAHNKERKPLLHIHKVQNSVESQNLLRHLSRCPHLMWAQVCPTRVMATLVQFPTIFAVLFNQNIKFWTWYSAFSCEPLAWDESFFESYQRDSLAFTLSFQLCWLHSAFHYQSAVSMQFRKQKNKNTILLSLDLSSLPPTHIHFECLNHLTDIAFSSANKSWLITYESFISWPATLLQGLPPGIGTSLPAREWLNQLLHTHYCPFSWLDHFWHQWSQVRFSRKQIWAWLESAKVYGKEQL